MKAVTVIIVNIVVCAGLCLGAEISYRVYRKGWSEAVATLTTDKPPYSNLGTSDWVIYDDVLGYRLNPMSKRINTRSIRHADIVLPKPDGVGRILFLGDSLLWDDPGWVAQVRTWLNGEGDFEVINASVPGYTSYQEVEHYRRYLRDVDADLVIWAYCMNDNHRFLHRFNSEARMLITDEAQTSLAINSPVDAIIARSFILSDLKIRWLAAEKRHDLATYSWDSDKGYNTAWKDFPWRDYEALLQSMIDMTAQDGAKLGVVIFPIEVQVLRDPPPKKRERDYIFKPQRILSGMCEKYDVPYLDLTQEFERQIASGNPSLFRDGLHLSEAGHLAAAEAFEAFSIDSYMETMEPYLRPRF